MITSQLESALVTLFDAEVRKVCPLIHGVSVGNPTDKVTWVIWFQDQATLEQRKSALDVLNRIPVLSAN